jgi:transcriptional regulator with XRE-family HTH domain
MFGRMDDRETTVRGRELGEGLRGAMLGSGLTGREAARRLGWSDSRVSRLLSGKRGGTTEDVSAFLAICGTTGRERDRLLELCREMSRTGWLQQHGRRLPEQLRTLIDHEDRAVTIGEFQPIVVPGLLQTADYARALLSGTGTLPREELDDRVTARLARQSVFGRGTRFTFFLHEFALRLPAGSAEVMSEQLHHLLRLSVRPYLTVRIVPAAAGVHAGIAGAFKLLEFAAIKPVVYLDSETASLFLEEEPEIATYREVMRALADTALDEGQSRDLIAGLATELYS